MTAAPFYDDALAAVHDADFSQHARAAAHVLHAQLTAAGLTRGTVVDLGCGGGVLAAGLAAAGYDVLGVDLSAAMVDLARRRVPTARFVRGSIWDVELPPAVAVTAIGEVVNYAADARAGTGPLRTLIERVRRALVRGGVLLFDVATPGRGGPSGSTTGVHDGDDHWLYAEAEERAGDGAAELERRVVLFRREGDLYRRFDEVHRLRLYDAEQIAELLAGAGFDVTVLEAYGDARLATGWVAFAATVP